jgi:hypothetical protein
MTSSVPIPEVVRDDIAYTYYATAGEMWGRPANDRANLSRESMDKLRGESDPLIEAAAPYIDRAARIDELRRLIDKEEIVLSSFEEPTSAVASADIERRIAELEALEDTDG